MFQMDVCGTPKLTAVPLQRVGYDLLLFTGAGVLMLNIAGQCKRVPFTRGIAVLPSAETCGQGMLCSSVSAARPCRPT